MRFWQQFQSEPGGKKSEERARQIGHIEMSEWRALYDKNVSGDVSIYVQRGTDKATLDLHSSISRKPSDDPASNPEVDKLIASAQEETASRNSRNEGSAISAFMDEKPKKPPS